MAQKDLNSFLTTNIFIGSRLLHVSKGKKFLIYIPEVLFLFFSPLIISRPNPSLSAET